MRSNKVIGFKNLPTKYPLTQTIAFTMALDYWGAPEWLSGIVYFILAIAWISSVYYAATEDRIDIGELINSVTNKEKTPKT